jgi:hypothetical protein
MGVAWILLVGFLTLPVAVGFAWSLPAGRRGAIGRWARREGWDYSPGRQRDRVLPFPHLVTGGVGTTNHHVARVIEHATAGLDGAHVEIFELSLPFVAVGAIVTPGLDLGRAVLGEPGAAPDLVDARMAALLRREPDWRIETGGRKLLVLREGRPTAGDFRDLARFALSFLAEIPGDLVNAERKRRGMYPLLRAGNAALEEPPGEL